MTLEKWGPDVRKVTMGHYCPKKIKDSPLKNDRPLLY